MSQRAIAFGSAVLAVGYIGSLLWLDAGQGTTVRELASAMPGLLVLAATGWWARSTRWRWLLRRAGHSVPASRSMISYFAGFAYTATPGKIGELVRIRYFAELGVPAWLVIAAFVFERACDLVAVLLLTGIAFADTRLLLGGAASVGVILVVITGVAAFPEHGYRLLRKVRASGFDIAWRSARMLFHGLLGCRTWLQPWDVLVSGTLGLVAWTTTAAALYWVLHCMGWSLPVLDVLPIYPVAMLVGAASMLPGGIGSTEGTIATMLVQAGLPLRTTIVAALGVRLTTLGAACALGLACVAALEANRANAPATPTV